MKRRITSVLAVITVALMLMFTLSSCFFANNSTTTETTEKPADPPALVKPAEAAEEINLKKEDPSNDIISFSYDEEGKVTECSYKKGDTSYFAGYTYRDGEVDVNTFATDKDGNAFVVDAHTYKTSGAFDKTLGFIEKDGYYFNGFKSLEEVARETKSAETTDKESSTASGADTTADSAKDTAADTTADATSEAETTGVETTGAETTGADTEKKD